MTIKRILVPVDFSEFSDNAVKYALFLAEKFCASVTLLHAVVLFHEDIDEEEHMKSYEAIIKKKEAERAKRMDIHCKLAEKKGISIKSVLIRGFSAADAVLEHTNEKKYDLIVMGTHGRSGLMKWWLGSVSEKVVRHSHVPVLTIHKEYKRHNLNKILVPVDFSDFSRNAVKNGKALAEASDAKLTFLHAVEQEAHPTFYASSLSPILKANPQLKKQITENLVKFTRVSKDEADYIVVEGKAHKAIAETAKKKGIHLIIMASRGDSALDHLLLGSNAERVVQVAHCPVLTVERKK